jgi:hypothetical protein
MFFKGPLSGKLNQHPEIRKYIKEKGKEATPRKISAHAFIIYYISSVSFMIAIILFMMFRIIPMQDLNDIYLDLYGFTNTAETTGIVTKTGNAGDGMHFLDYKYTIDGTKFTGFSYVKGSTPRVNSSTQIEYARQDPALSRVKGGQYSKGFLSLKLPLGILIIVLGVFFYFTFRFIKRILLLRSGHFTMAKIKSIRDTGASVNYQSVKKITYRFEANGQQREYVIKTHEIANLTDEAEEIMLYNPNSFSKFDMVLIDQLPANLSLKNENNGKWVLGQHNSISILRSPFLGLFFGWFASSIFKSLF